MLFIHCKIQNQCEVHHGLKRSFIVYSPKAGAGLAKDSMRYLHQEAVFVC